MNDQQKIYAPVSAKQIKFNSGGSILKLGINVEKFKAFLDQHKNAKGYVNLGISERRQVSQYGESHTVWLDTYQPKSGGQQSPRQNKPVSAPPPPEEDAPPF